MRKCRNVCVYFLICLFLLSSLSVSYGQENEQIKIEDLELDSIHYEDKDYLYFKIDRQIARLKKDFSGQYEILSEEEKNYIEEMKANEETFKVKQIEIDNKEIEINGDYLYYNGIQLLDIKKHIDEDNEFYIQNPERERVPMAFYLQKYTLNDSKTLYSIIVYTCGAISAPYTPTYRNYVMIEDGTTKILDLNKKSFEEEDAGEVAFELWDVYINNNRVWLVGYHYYSWHSIFDTSIYYIDEKGNTVAVDEIVSSLNKNVHDNNEQFLALRLVGMSDKRVVFDDSEKKYSEGQNINIYYKLNALYEMTQELEIKRMNVDESIVNEKYTKENDVFYLGKNNEIYYISDNPHGVVNLTNGQFKKFGLSKNNANEEAGENTNTYIPILINGEYIEFNDKIGYPFIDENNRTQVPFRIILEKIGAKVEWNNETRTAIAEKDGIKVEVPIDKTFILKNGERIENDTKALIKDERTYLPIRVVLEAFGYEVGWDGKTITVKM